MAECNWPIFCLDGKAKISTNVEKIFPGRHVTQNEWDPGWNQDFLTNQDRHCYDFISDYEVIFDYPINHRYIPEMLWENLQRSKRRGTPVPITELAHFTDENSAKQIIKDNFFIGGEKIINEDSHGNDVTACLSWWSPIFTEEQIHSVENHLRQVLEPFISEQDREDAFHMHRFESQFARSDAFWPQGWRFGNHSFQYSLDELIDCYRDCYGEVQYKILGTFAYKQEVMHAVLVCNEAYGDSKFSAYPDVPETDFDTETTVIERDGLGNWIWKPQATGDEITRLKAFQQAKEPWGFQPGRWKNPRFRRWENVAFAFHIPDGEMEFEVPHPEDHLKIISNCNKTVK